MGSDADYQDILDDEIDVDGPLLEEFPRTRNARSDKDYRRAIEELREEKRLRALLNDFDLDDL
jgi:hypothetical protein